VGAGICFGSEGGGMGREGGAGVDLWEMGMAAVEVDATSRLRSDPGFSLRTLMMRFEGGSSAAVATEGVRSTLDDEDAIGAEEDGVGFPRT